MKKTLKEINREKIIEEFGDIHSFYSTMDLISSQLKGKEKLMIKEMTVYYRNLFNIKEMSLEEDVVDLANIALKNISDLESLEIQCDTVVFLAELIKHNIAYMAR